MEFCHTERITLLACEAPCTTIDASSRCDSFRDFIEKEKKKTFQVSFDHCPFGNVDNLRSTREAASTPLLQAHVVAGQA